MVYYNDGPIYSVLTGKGDGYLCQGSLGCAPCYGCLGGPNTYADQQTCFSSCNVNTPGTCTANCNLSSTCTSETNADMVLTCSNGDTCSNTDYSSCIPSGIIPGLQSQGWEVLENKYCCICDSSDPIGISAHRYVYSCCAGSIDMSTANKITVQGTMQGDCVWCGVMGDGATLDENGLWTIYRCNSPTE